MSRQSWLLFLIPVVVWSTTFYAITWQLDSPITPAFAVALRFGVAAVLLFAWLLLRRELRPMPWALHALAAASGICAYGLSYVCTYLAERDIASGLVAIAFTSMVFLTPLLARVALGTPIARATWLGGSLGVLGVIGCFLPDLLAADASTTFVRGMLSMGVAAMASSVAATISLRLNASAVPVTTYTAWAMAWGSLATVLYALIRGQTLAWETRLSFWVAFAWLTLAGTLLTFLCYLTLLKREGTARTMYISVLSPIGAVLISITFEGFRPQALTWVGIGFALFGAWITMRSNTR